MTKRIRLIIVALAVTLVLVISSIIIVYAVKKNSNAPYYLKTLDSRIALYRGDTVVEIYDDTNIDLLTDYDRYLLRNGILVEDVEKIDEILEDYNS